MPSRGLLHICSNARIRVAAARLQRRRGQSETERANEKKKRESWLFLAVWSRRAWGSLSFSASCKLRPPAGPAGPDIFTHPPPANRPWPFGGLKQGCSCLGSHDSMTGLGNRTPTKLNPKPNGEMALQSSLPARSTVMGLGPRDGRSNVEQLSAALAFFPEQPASSEGEASANSTSSRPSSQLPSQLMFFAFRFLVLPRLQAPTYPASSLCRSRVFLPYLRICPPKMLFSIETLRNEAHPRRRSGKGGLQFTEAERRLLSSHAAGTSDGTWPSPQSAFGRGVSRAQPPTSATPRSQTLVMAGPAS